MPCIVNMLNEKKTKENKEQGDSMPRLHIRYISWLFASLRQMITF